MAVEYSVLMSVYYKEKAEYLKESIESMLSQSVPTNDFVIVCDGPLTEELNEVLDKYSDNPIINIVKLERNAGLGNALAEGIKHCKNELIARMDSDDISSTKRCEKQLAIFDTTDVDVIGSNISEFVGTPETVVGTRNVPETHCQIEQYAKKRNPMNHPSVMFKKSKVLKCGNYQPFLLYEDYHLWIKMIIAECRFYNIQEPLVNMRTTYDMYMRRSGVNYFKSGLRFQRFMLENHYIKYGRYFLNLFERFFVQVLIPNGMRKKIYTVLLRK